MQDRAVSLNAVIERIKNQYNEHNELIPKWLSIGDLPSVEPQAQIKDAIAEIEHLNEYDYPKDDRTISKFKDVVIGIIRSKTGVSNGEDV